MLRLYRPMLVAGLTAGLLATSAMLPASAQNGPPDYVTQANAPLDVNVFYDQLGQYGTWVQHPDYQYVFIPTNVGPDWRPYQEGRWVWTDQYGWYWESYEPFGWATYHYGRWGYDPSYGWFWVPGDTWSPAWVTWRRGGGRTGWAPIAPDRPGYAVGRANYYAPPVAESWVFVEDRYMGEQDLAVYVAPIPQTNVFLAAAPDYYEPSWDNGYYVNRGFDYDVYDGSVRDRLYTRDVVFVENRNDVFYGNGQLGIFAPAIALGNRYGPPPRYERRLDPNQRAIIRQYVADDRDMGGAYTPSAALLNVLEPSQRRELRQARFNQPDMYRQQMEQLEQQRAVRLDEMRRKAMARNAQIAAQQQMLNDQRRAQADRMQQQYIERAQRMQGNPGMQPGYRPAALPGGPANAPNAAQQDMMQRQRAQQQQQEQFRAQQLQNQQQAVEAQRRAAEQQQQMQQQRAQQAQQLRAQQQQQAVEAQRRAAEQQQQIQQQRAAQQQAIQQQRAAQQQLMQQQRAAQQEKALQAQQQRAAQQQQIQQQRAAQQQAVEQQRAAQQAQRAAQQQAVQQQRAAQQQQIQQQRAAQQQLIQQQRAQQMQQMRGQQPPPPPQQQPQQPPARRPGNPDPNQPPPQ